MSKENLKASLEWLKECAENDYIFETGYSKELYNYIEQLQQENNQLKEKYNKALELLVEFGMACEKDDFMLKHSDYCEIHCGVDEEQYKKCWDKYIEWKIKDEE